MGSAPHRGESMIVAVGEMDLREIGMTQQPKPESPKGDEAELNRVLRNLVNTQHKTHAPRDRDDASAEDGVPSA